MLRCQPRGIKAGARGQHLVLLAFVPVSEEEQELFSSPRLSCQLLVDMASLPGLAALRFPAVGARLPPGAQALRV